MALVFDDLLAALSKRATTLGSTLATEEATKNALVMPFLQALGYDVFNPSVVVPEFTADHGIKKGEKVDYAIKKGDEIIILVECKPFGANLSAVHISQLFRYFSVTSASIAILTNGTEYRFYSDLDTKNKMDASPFFTFDITNFQSAQIKELSKFRAENFAIEEILETANDLKYLNLLKAEILKEIDNPSSELTELLARRVYGGRLTAGVREWLGSLSSQAMRQIIREIVNRRLSDAIDRPENGSTPEGEKQQISEIDHNSTDGVNTTEEEIEAFQIVRAILRHNFDVKRIFMRDAKSYCAILLDDNNRKPIVRLYLEGKIKRIGLFNEKKEEKIEIETVDDIFNFSDRITQAASEY